MSELKVWAMIVLSVAMSGCRMGAELYTWETPIAAQGVGKRVAIAPIYGPSEITGNIAGAIETNRPTAQLDIAIVSHEELQEHDPIQLVSFDDGVASDLAFLPVARRAEVDFLLIGEVLSNRVGSKMPLPSAAEEESNDDVELEQIVNSGRLMLSWKVLDVKTGKTVWARPLSISSDMIAARYPDLVMMQKTEIEQLTEAAARETWRLLTPFIDKHRVQLALPWGSFGAEQTRSGNAYARAGKWSEAETHWRSAISSHPRQHAALHNLAVAAVARQDFAEAKELATQALSRKDCDHYQSTLVWIEARQREYHAAFNLPEPEDGWRFAPSKSEAKASAAASLETTDNSRWTFKEWITQPIPL